MPKGERALPQACRERLRAAERIVHAGDLSTLSVLEDLRAIGPPVTAVHGNVDEPAVRAALPETALVPLGVRRIAIVHDAGPAKGRLARMRRRFPEVDAVIFGHSHLPLLETATDGGFAIVNPGSPTERRRAPAHTMALAALDGGGALRFEIIVVD